MERIGSKTYEDVPLYTYGPASSMHDIDLQKANGFCNPNTPRYFNNTYIQPKGCAPVGVMDVSSCIDGNARIYMSQPHFFGSHPALHDAIEGLAPASEDNDNTVLGIEPATAVVVFADQRTQLNVGVINGGLPSLKAMGPRIIPLIWIRELATFDAATRKQLLMLTGIRGGVFVASIVSFLLFCSAFVGTGIIIVLRSRQQVSRSSFCRAKRIKTVYNQILSGNGHYSFVGGNGRGRRTFYGGERVNYYSRPLVHLHHQYIFAYYFNSIFFIYLYITVS